MRTEIFPWLDNAQKLGSQWWCTGEDVEAGNRGQEKKWEECSGSGWVVQVYRATFLLQEAVKTLQSPCKTKTPHCDNTG